MAVALGIDTSCYTTSVAAADEQGAIVAFSRMLLPVPSGQRGLRQSEAVFAHMRQMPQVAAEALDAIDALHADICSIAASSRPCDEKDSYMPVFSVGLGYAQTLARALRVPCYETTHQRGHIAAGLIGQPPIGERFLALHLSGGTTDLLAYRPEGLEKLGGSLDLHAGQLVDRVGVALGLAFPAGPALEALALRCGEPPRALLPASLERGDLYCHLSGAEAQCMRLIEAGDCSREQLALEVFDLLSRTVARMLHAGALATGDTKALVIGGVSSSALLRQMLARRVSRQRAKLELRFGEAAYSSDNAAGVARIAMEQWIIHQGGSVCQPFC